MVVLLVVYFMHSSDPCFLRSHQPKCRQPSIKTSHWGSPWLLPLFTGLAPLHPFSCRCSSAFSFSVTLHVPPPHVALLWSRVSHHHSQHTSSLLWLCCVITEVWILSCQTCSYCCFPSLCRLQSGPPLKMSCSHSP